MGKAIIFDFDGTLADSVPIIRSIYMEMARKNNWKVMTDEDYEVLRRGSLREARRWSGIRFWQVPMVLRSAQKLMTLEAEKVELFPDIVSLVKDLKRLDADLYVLSRNSPATIRRVLERHDIHEDLQILSRRKRSFGSKAAAIKRVLRLRRYDGRNVWMVGDEVRDILAAHNAGVKSVAVAWGIQDIEILERHSPTETVHSVDELRRILLA
jgi:phosphoglycolate phosphatase